MPEDEPSRADSEHTQVAERATLLDEDQPNSSAVQEGAMAKHKAPSAQTLALVLLPLLALLVVVVQLGGPTETLQRVQGLVADGGTAGPFIFAAAYVVATVALLPAAILTLAAGYLYGPLAGTALVSVCSTTACAVAFLISRYLVCTRRERLKESGAGGLTREAKARVERLVETMPRVAALQDAIASEGGRVVLLLRLSPLIPFALSNYFFGITRVRFAEYVVASWVGMLPGTFAYVYLGGAGRSTVDAVGGADRNGLPVAKIMLYVVGAAATILATTRLSKLASASLDRSLAARAVSAADEPREATDSPVVSATESPVLHHSSGVVSRTVDAA